MLQQITAALCAAIVAQAAVASIAGAQESGGASETHEVHVPMRALTQGPSSHWFGYYDKDQFSPDGRYVLGMRTDFEDRAPAPDDVIELGMVGLEEDGRWTPIGETRAWCWQQGAMLQWLPGSDTEVIYNDRHGDRFVSVIRDVFTGTERVLPRPVYAVSPNGKEAVSLNFSRLDDTRPGYGYTGLKDPWADEAHPDDDGIYLLNLETGASRLIISLGGLVRAYPQEGMEGRKHWFNHLLFNPDGTRFVFLHRWHRNPDGRGGWFTRMFTANPDGTELHCVADHEMVSHFIWRNPRQILAWSREPDPGDRFHLYTDQSDAKEVIGEGVLTRDGHCTYSPDGRWILTDTYPDRDRMQHLFLYRPDDGRVVQVGKFYLPPYDDVQLRCDLHPGWSRDGRYVCIDSMHEGGQRQMYLLDVSAIVLDSG